LQVLIDRLSERSIYLLIVLAGIALFVPFLGSVHLFDWDEINFAEAAREMIVTGDYTRVQIDYEPFWEKPPLFIWTQVVSMKLFGVNEFAARFPNAVVGVVTLLVLYVIGRRTYDRRFGLLWVLVYAGSLLPAFYFRSGIIDPLFNLMIFLAMYHLFRHYETASKASHGAWKPVLLSGVFAGLAVLTKGPVGYLLVAVSWGVYWWVRRSGVRFPLAPAIAFTAVAAAVAGLWFGLELALHGTWFVSRFIAYQIRLLTTGDAGHGQPVYYHPVILFLGCFPASAI
jgi:4-amino-4-deoxy-L-arabinose transferase-like glycosyltransferase